MNNHGEIRELLPLAAAGVLDAGEQRAVKEHVARCEACARELRLLEAVSFGVRLLPTPVAPGWLVNRTCERVRESLASERDSRESETALVFASLLAWTVSLSMWFLYKVFTGGMPALFNAGFTQISLYLGASTVLAWLTAAVAVVALGRVASQRRRIS